jgi:UDP-glucose 4-epimerase
MNIAITGIAGYLGRTIANRLLGIESYRIFGVDLRVPDSPQPPDFEKLDVRSPALERFFKDRSIQTVIHLAFAMPPVRNIRAAYNVDVIGTRNVLECALRAGVRKLIVAGSTTSYGAYPDNPEKLTEESPLRGIPGYYYSDHKIQVEGLCREFVKSHPGMDITVMRMCYIYGPGVDTAYSRQLSAKSVYLFKGFDPPLQFLHEEDLGEAFALAAAKECAGVYNVTPDDAVRLSDAVQSAGRTVKWVEMKPGALAVAKMLSELRIMHTPVSAWEYWKHRWVADNRRFKTDFGFSPRYGSMEAFLSAYGAKP